VAKLLNVTSLPKVTELLNAAYPLKVVESLKVASLTTVIGLLNVAYPSKVVEPLNVAYPLTPNAGTFKSLLFMVSFNNFAEMVLGI
jgi:hypothetical protein